VAVSNVELRVGATQAITALKNVNTQAQKFNQTVNGTNSKLKDANKALPMLSKGFFGAGAGAKGAALGFRTAGVALATALGPLTAGLTLVAALTKTFGNLAAQDFANAKVRALGVDAENLTPALASLSNELSGQVSKLDLLAASYDLASAGFGEVAELTDVLKASQLGASGGFSDLATVADATTSVLNSYGLEADKAGKIVDGFIQTQNDGRIVVDQYAQQIGRIAPIAAASGVSIDELNAAIAAVTATGVPVESTFAGLRQVISAIIKPTGEAAKTAEKLGIDFSAAALQSKGLSGVLAEIVEKSGGSSEEIAKLFGSVEALTAIQPLLNDELVKFNEALANQANAQGEAAKASFIASNTIQGQLTRLGSAFTNLTTEGSEFGIVIREVLKVAAVTVEALKSAFEITLAPIRLIVGVVKQIGTVIGQALGIEATNVLFNLEQGWINIKEAITQVVGEAEFIGRVIGGVISVTIKNVIQLQKSIIQAFTTAAQPIINFFSGIRKSVLQTALNLVKAFKNAFQQVIDLIPQPLKDLLGGLELPEINLDIKLPEFEDVFTGVGEKITEIKDAVIEYSEVERVVTEENNKQLDAKNNIVATNRQIKTGVDELSESEKQATEEAEKLQETFEKIGESVKNDLVSNLREAIKGSQSFGQAINKVLDKMKDKLLDMALNEAISGLGGMFGGNNKGGFLGGLIGGLFADGGRPPVGKASIVGERGPELFVPSTAGTIIPNNKLGGGDSITNIVNVSVDASGSSVEGDGATSQQLGQTIALVVQETLVKEKRNGGLLA